MRGKSRVRKTIPYLIIEGLIFCFVAFITLQTGCRSAPPNHKYNDSTIFKLIEKRKFADATKILDSLIEKDDRNGMAFFYKGLIEKDLENFRESIPYFQRACELNYQKDICLDMIKFSTKMDSIKQSYTPDERSRKK